MQESHAGWFKHILFAKRLVAPLILIDDSCNHSIYRAITILYNLQ